MCVCVFGGVGGIGPRDGWQERRLSEGWGSGDVGTNGPQKSDPQASALSAWACTQRVNVWG